MDPINPEKTVSETETDDVTISAPDSSPASGANNDANLQGQQQQPQPQQAQGPGQSGQVGGAAGSCQLPTMESLQQLVSALELPNNHFLNTVSAQPMKQSKEWHASLTPDLRNHLVHKL